MQFFKQTGRHSDCPVAVPDSRAAQIGLVLCLITAFLCACMYCVRVLCLRTFLFQISVILYVTQVNVAYLAAIREARWGKWQAS